MKTLTFTYGETKVWALIMLLAILFAGCRDNSTSQSEESTIVLSLIESNPDLETFSSLINGTSLTTTLSGSGPVTIFAPNDEAFDQLPEGYLENLTNDQLLDILQYHIYGDKYPVNNEIKRQIISSIQGDNLFMEVGQTTGNRVNNVEFVSTNIEAGNGIIHIIDAVLLPDDYGTLADNTNKRYNYRSFYSKMEEAGLLDMLNEPGNKTLLASASDVLDRLEFELGVTLTQEDWGKIMQYHILDQDISLAGLDTKTVLATMSGDSVFVSISHSNEYRINNSLPISGFIKSTNGRILFVDGVMLPDKFSDVLSVIIRRPYLSTISGALYTTGLAESLHPFNNEETTIFVPSDRLDLNDWQELSALELREILQYHIVNGKWTTDQLQDGQTYTTRQGETITIQRSGDTVTINGTVTIAVADVEAINGVVHILDGVLKSPEN